MWRKFHKWWDRCVSYGMAMALNQRNYGPAPYPSTVVRAGFNEGLLVGVLIRS